MPGSGVRRVWLDLLVGPLSLVLVLLCSLLVPVRAQAQTNMTLQQLVPNLIRNISQTVSATPSGLTVLQAGQVDIGVGAMNTGTGIIGRVMINEARAVTIASIASRAVTLGSAVGLAMLAVDLAKYGITQCLSSPNGWCKPGPVNANQSDTGFNGYQWCYGGGTGGPACGDSPASACVAVLAKTSGFSPTFTGISANGSQYSCNYTYNGTAYNGNSSVAKSSSCVTNYILSNGSCVPNPAVSVPPAPIQYPELATNLSQVLSGNPSRSKDYWGIMPPDQWYAALGDPSTQALPAQVVTPADGKVVGPRTTTTTSAGTTTTQQTVTVSPNTDSGTLASNPVTVTTTTTTTNPDGTTTTTTSTENPTGGGTAGGGNPAPQPASSPVPCGLGTSGSPKCQIDETGTPTTGGAAMTQPATDLQTAEQTAVTQLNNVNNGLSWTLHMPHILPGGTCQPIEWFSWGSWRGSWDVCTQLQYVRDLLAWLWPVLSAVYVWNKAAGANAGVV